MQCLVGELMQLSASRTSDSILSTYRTAIAHCSTLDKPHFLWGSFMDTLLRSELDVQIDDSDRRDVIKKLVPDIIHHYLLSVMSSSGYVFDTLPRVVTLWCEHAEVFVPNGTSKSKGGPSSNRVNDVAAWISDWIKKVSPHSSAWHGITHAPFRSQLTIGTSYCLSWSPAFRTRTRLSKSFLPPSSCERFWPILGSLPGLSPRFAWSFTCGHHVN